jgi:hypothetical protein
VIYDLSALERNLNFQENIESLTTSLFWTFLRDVVTKFFLRISDEVDFLLQRKIIFIKISRKHEITALTMITKMFNEIWNLKPEKITLARVTKIQVKCSEF